ANTQSLHFAVLSPGTQPGLLFWKLDVEAFGAVPRQLPRQLLAIRGSPVGGSPSRQASFLETMLAHGVEARHGEGDVIVKHALKPICRNDSNPTKNTPGAETKN